MRRSRVDSKRDDNRIERSLKILKNLTARDANERCIGLGSAHLWNFTERDIKVSNTYLLCKKSHTHLFCAAWQAEEGKAWKIWRCYFQGGLGWNSSQVGCSGSKICSDSQCNKCRQTKLRDKNGTSTTEAFGPRGRSKTQGTPSTLTKKLKTCIYLMKLGTQLDCCSFPEGPCLSDEQHKFVILVADILDLACIISKIWDYCLDCEFSWLPVVYIHRLQTNKWPLLSDGCTDSIQILGHSITVLLLL